MSQTNDALSAGKSSDKSSTARTRPTTRDADRRRHRRHQPAVNDPSSVREESDIHGEIVDLSSGGLLMRTDDPNVRPGDSVHVCLTLPAHAGIQPFIRLAGATPEPTCEWRGRFDVARRVDRGDGTFDLGGRFADMTPVDRGMLGLYLSTQPLAA
jgi:hypothetical protein